MDKTESIKCKLDEKAISVNQTLEQCRKSTKNSWKLFYETGAFAIGGVAIFFNLKDVLDGTNLVMACIPPAVAVITSGILTVRNFRKTDNLYDKLHDLDIEIFDLKMDLFRLENNIDAEDDQISLCDEENTKTLKKDFI